MAQGEQKLRVLRALLEKPRSVPELRAYFVGDGLPVPQTTIYAVVAREVGRLTAWVPKSSPMRYALTVEGRRWVLGRLVAEGELEAGVPLERPKPRGAEPRVEDLEEF
jgi:hypothetical protein